LDLSDEIAKAVVQIDAELGESRGVFGEQIFKEDADKVAEDDRIGDLHHSRLEVHGEEQAFGLGSGELSFNEGDERPLAEHGGVDDLAGLERGFFLEGLRAAVGGDEFNLNVGCGGNSDGFLVGEEIVLAHGGDGGLRRR